MYNYVSEIGTNEITQTMLYAQWIIPIVIQNTSFPEIVAARMLNGVLHLTKLLCR